MTLKEALEKQKETEEGLESTIKNYEQVIVDLKKEADGKLGSNTKYEYLFKALKY